MARQQPRLHQRHHAERHGLGEQRVGQCVLLALLVGHHHRLARIALQQHGTAFAQIEIISTELATVDERQRQPIRPGAELFHQVECQCGAAGAHGMQEAELRVEPGGLAGRTAIVGPHRVKE